MFKHIKESPLKYDDLTTIEGEKRLYNTPDGNRYPSITTILSILSRDSIEKWKKKVGEEEAKKVSYRASQRGTAVHEICEKYIDNEPDYKKGYMPNVIGDFLRIKPILDERIGLVYAQEVPLYSDYLQVAGRVDCIAEFDGVLSVIDFKTSKKPKRREWIRSYFQQEAFYAIAWEEQTKIPIGQLVTIISCDNGQPQVFIEKRDDWAPELLNTIRLWREENDASQNGLLA